jgi:peptide/nickel transport system permease protein
VSLEEREEQTVTNRTWAQLSVFVGKRLLQLVPVVIGVAALTFFFSHMAVANPCAIWVPRAHPAQVANCVQYFGLDQPVWVQFGRYLSSLVSGNWGTDPLGGQPVLPVVLSSAPESLELVLTALLIIIVVGIPLGATAAYFADRFPDHVIRIFYMIGWSTPTYLLAVAFVVAVGPALGLPGSGDFTSPPAFPQIVHMSVIDALLAGNLPATWDAVRHLILPSATMALVNLGLITRMARNSVREVLPLDYVKTARMKGLREWVVLYKHVLRNSLITTTTIIGLMAGALLSGTVIVETIFEWPGIGLYAYDAISTYNYAGTEACVIIFAVVFVLGNLIADILYAVLDPTVEWR